MEGSSGGDLTDYLLCTCVCAAAMRILVNKSHNNAVITNDVFLLVELFVLYTKIWNLGGGGGGGGGGIPVRMQP